MTSMPSSNSTITRENPSRENERMLLMPLIVLITSSIGRVTSCITASDDAPGYEVCTCTNGNVMSGIWSTDRR